jgi:hypothetical protein
MVQNLHQICIRIKLGANLASKFKMDAKTAISKGAIWDEFSEQH